MDIGQLLQAPDPLALYEALQARDNQAQKTQHYQNMSQSNYGAAGTLGIIGNLFGGIMASRNRKKSNEANHKFAQQQNVYNQELVAFKAQQEQRKAEQQRQQKLQALIPEFGEQGAKAIVYGGAKPSDVKHELTTLQRNLSDPQARAYLEAGQAKSNAPVINVNNGKTESVFAEALARGNAKKFNDWEGQAIASNEMLGKLNQMEQISSAQQTGKVNEALAMAGQWFGTEAGSSLQAFNAVQKDLMLDAASNLKGAMSDGEWRVLQAKMPDFGNDPRANQQILGILKGAAQRNVSRYEQSSKYINDNGKLQGFKPEFNYSQDKKETLQQQGKSQTINGKQYVQIDGQWYEQ